MAVASILKCIMLSQLQVNIVEVHINEFATANMNKIYNGTQFEAIVFEGKLNSISIETLEQPLKTISYSARDYDQKSMSTRLDFNGRQSSLECEIK